MPSLCSKNILRHSRLDVYHFNGCIITLSYPTLIYLTSFLLLTVLALFVCFLWFLKLLFSVINHPVTNICTNIILFWKFPQEWNCYIKGDLALYGPD